MLPSRTLIPGTYLSSCCIARRRVRGRSHHVPTLNPDVVIEFRPELQYQHIQGEIVLH